jgi:uncharacterized membrane protein required for colicin V production
VAPSFSGTIYGIISGLASVNSWLAPLVVASLTEAQVKKKTKIEKQQKNYQRDEFYGFEEE